MNAIIKNKTFCIKITRAEFLLLKYTYYACDSGIRHFEQFWEFRFPKLADNNL